MKTYKTIIMALSLTFANNLFACSAHDHHATCAAVCPCVERIQEIGFDQLYNPAAAQPTIWAAGLAKNSYGYHHGSWSFVLKAFSAKDVADAKVQAKNLISSLKFVQLQRLPHHQLICVYKTNQDQAIGLALSPANKLK